MWCVVWGVVWGGAERSGVQHNWYLTNLKQHTAQVAFQSLVAHRVSLGTQQQQKEHAQKRQERQGRLPRLGPDVAESDKPSLDQIQSRRGLSPWRTEVQRKPVKLFLFLHFFSLSRKSNLVAHAAAAVTRAYTDRRLHVGIDLKVLG